MAVRLDFTGESKNGRAPLVAEIENLVIAGWTGRDAKAVQHHIDELQRLGVKPPKSTPIFYRVGAQLLTQQPAIEVAGGDSSGEVEPVLVSLAGGLWVGVGSDHTDRKLETVGVTLSKQACPKPVSATLWPFAELEDHWDRLILRSHAVIGGRRRLYQEGPVARLRTPGELIALYPQAAGRLAPGTTMFCGTMAVEGAIEPGERFEIELEDPVLGRRIAHAYQIKSLPVEG